MLLSVDSRSYLFSKIKHKKYFSDNLPEILRKFLGEGSGPQEFITELLLEINSSKKIQTTYNFIKSDLHLLNLGFYSQIWKYLKLKEPNKVVIRFDGIGIDSCKNVEETRYNLNKILSKGRFIIFQSQFCKSFFQNEFGYLPRNVVINNGAKKLINKKIDLNNFKRINLRIPQDENYFVVAGRFTGRKRIKETIESFSKFNKYNLVVLSNIPDKEKIDNTRIKYIGIQKAILAREIIYHSKALVHMDSYDWCPNIVISALADNIPVICSNYGGTCEIVRDNGLIIKEFPEDLTANMDGVNFTKSSIFPENLLYDALYKINNLDSLKDNTENYSISKCAEKYIKTFQDNF